MASEGQTTDAPLGGEDGPGNEAWQRTQAIHAAELQRQARERRN